MSRTEWLSSAFPRLLAKALILWDERIDRGCVASTDPGLLEGFSDHLYKDFRSESNFISRTDIDAALELFIRDHGSLIEWYRALIAPAGMEIDWRDRQPLIHPNSVTAWENLTADFDADALLALHLLDRARAGDHAIELSQLLNWKTIPRVGDHELSVIWSRGLSDLHVHVSGLRIPHLAWQELLVENASIQSFRILSRIYRENGSDLKSAMSCAKDAWVRLREITQSPPYDRAWLRSTNAEWWRDTYPLFHHERAMLVSAWSSANAATVDGRQVLEILDRYLSHKNRFFRLVRQSAFESVPGLRQFDVRYFSALKRTTSKNVSLEYGSSPRLEMTPYGDACQYLMESKDLRHAELRIAPFERSSDYLRFFRLWNELKCRLDRVAAEQRRTLPEFRYAIHFKRTRDKESFTRRQPDSLVKRLNLDRQTAALRLALSDLNPRHQKLMRSLSRIDVAGQERDTPLALFGIYLNLLRGNPELLRYLEENSLDSLQYFGLKHWKRLEARGVHRPRLGQARLGLTVHAGEDFADLLDGLYQIGSAVEILGLQSGDGIGHGLALASKFENVGRRAPEFVIMPRGTAHDSLCWLFDFTERHNAPSEHARDREVLRGLIKRTAPGIYGDTPALLAADAEDYAWVWRRTVAPHTASPPSEIRMALLRKSETLESLMAREDISPVHRERRAFDALVLWAQEILLKQVKTRRIIIEMNPSSNLRVSGAMATQDSPTVRLFQAVADGLLACINTDDPGIFTSCIENEYALLLDGATKADMPVGMVRDLLERVRQIGMELVYWPPGEASLRWRGNAGNEFSPDGNQEPA